MSVQRCAAFHFLAFCAAASVAAAAPLRRLRPASRSAAPLASRFSRFNDGDEQAARARAQAANEAEASEPLTPEDLERAGAGGLRQEVERRLRARKASETLYFVGDSTIRNQYMAFCAVLEGENKFKPLPKDDIMACNDTTISAVFVWAAFFSDSAVQQLVTKGYAPPTAVFFGAGLHLLHLVPSHAWTMLQYRHWSRYETDLTDCMLGYQKAAPEAKLLVMATHSICEDKFYGGWLQVARATHDDLLAAAAPCVESLARRGYGNTTATRADCQDGFSTQAGVAALNGRLVRTLNNLGRLEDALVDDFTLTAGQCDASSDGRHYNDLVLAELLQMFDKLGWE